MKTNTGVKGTTSKAVTHQARAENKVTPTAVKMKSLEPEAIM